MQEGSNIITVTAKDAANNSATANLTITFTGESDDGGMGTEESSPWWGVHRCGAVHLLPGLEKEKKEGVME